MHGSVLEIACDQASENCFSWPTVSFFFLRFCSGHFCCSSCKGFFVVESRQIMRNYGSWGISFRNLDFDDRSEAVDNRCGLEFGLSRPVGPKLFAFTDHDGQAGLPSNSLCIAWTTTPTPMQRNCSQTPGRVLVSWITKNRRGTESSSSSSRRRAGKWSPSRW